MFSCEKVKQLSLIITTPTAKTTMCPIEYPRRPSPKLFWAPARFWNLRPSKAKELKLAPSAYYASFRSTRSTPDPSTLLIYHLSPLHPTPHRHHSWYQSCLPQMMAWPLRPFPSWCYTFREPGITYSKGCCQDTKNSISWKASLICLAR